MQHDLSKGHLETTFRSMETEVLPGADGYGRERSCDSYKSRVIVRERRGQKVVLEDLEGHRGIHTPSVGSGRRF